MSNSIVLGATGRAAIDERTVLATAAAVAVAALDSLDTRKASR